MKETLSLWLKIFSSPVEGYKQISPQTKIGYAFLLIIILNILAFSPLIPVLSSDEYSEASTRSSLHLIEKYQGKMTEEDKEVAFTAAKQPLQKTISVVSTLFSSVVSNILLSILLGSFLLWLSLFIFKNALKYKAIVTIFVFTDPVLIFQFLLRNLILLFSDYALRFNAVTNLHEFIYAQNVSLSLATFLPLESTPILIYNLIDYTTDIFNILFFVFLFFGIKALTYEKSFFKNLAPIILTGLVSLILYVVIPALLNNL